MGLNSIIVRNYSIILYLIEGGDSLLEWVECVGCSGCCKLSSQGLQLDHQTGVQRLQERRLRLLLLHLQTLYQLLQLQHRVYKNRPNISVLITAQPGISVSF